jgi:hypothetical protein
VQAADLAGLRGTGETDWVITGGTTYRARDCDGLADT